MSGRIKVVFASLLKPVDEPRMYDKLGSTLAQTYKYDVNIIGFESKNLLSDPLIRFWPIFNFKRISLARAFAPLKFFRKLLQVKPELIVVNTPDLLAVSSLYKILFGAYIIYDLQENYYRNIIWSHDKPSLLRKIRAGLIRSKEYVLDRMIIRYVLAETCYSIECSFISKPKLILENKARKPQGSMIRQAQAFKTSTPLRLLYAGTIAESYGILDTFAVADAIHSLHPHIQYTILGHCPSERVLQRLQKEAAKRPWVDLQASLTPVPHPDILQHLNAADFTFVAYQLNPANRECMPTRIWEALAWQTPVILRMEHPWVDLIEQHSAGFAIDFLKPDLVTLKHHLARNDYFTQALPEHLFWESQEAAWIAFVDDLFA